MDFCFQRLENGRHARILGVLDCFTRECLLLKAASSFPSFLVEKELEWLFLVHGRPQGVVSDNGPEFRAMTLPEGVESRFIQPGAHSNEFGHWFQNNSATNSKVIRPGIPTEFGHL